MALILSLETATPVCSVALSKDGQLLSFSEEHEGFSHAEKLTVFIQQVLKENNFSPSDLNAVAVSSGPGSYTGLRIGVSVAKGLCYALNIPLISISTLEAMAAGAIAQFPSADLYCPMIDARRMEVYCAVYDQRRKLIEPVATIVIDENFLQNLSEKIIYFGDGASKCRPVLPDTHFRFEEVKVSARHLFPLAEEKWKQKSFEDVSLFEPFYLKEFYSAGKK